MKAWRPSPPSQGLRSRIFVTEAEAEPVIERAGFDFSALTRWLVPAVGCFLILTASVVPPEAQPAEAWSGDRLAYSAMASAHRDINQKNTVPATSLERTFGQRAVVTSDPFAGSETNTLSK